jgi:hypothetical protein
VVIIVVRVCILYLVFGEFFFQLYRTNVYVVVLCRIILVV